MRIAHLSDLHLRHHLPGTSALVQRESRRMPELLARAVALLRRDSPDLLALTGDLLDYPLEELQHPERLEQGEQDLRLIADLLRQLDCPSVVLYGNHDPEALVRRVFPLTPDQVLAGYRVVCFQDREAEDHAPERQGEERARFEQVLADPASPPQVHVQHYLVWPRRDEGYPHTYRESETLLEAITGSGLVRLVLSGHYHPGLPPLRVGETWFATVPAFAEAPHVCWLYDLEQEGLAYHALTLD